MESLSTDEAVSLEVRKLALEERRFEAEQQIKLAELAERRAQREGDEKKNDQDAELKRLELNTASGSWFRFTGAQATVAAAAVALISGTIGGSLQAWSSRTVEDSKNQASLQIEKLKADADIKLEAQKQESSEKLDRAKFETTLILKAIESSSREEQIRNLKFFLTAGFIKDPEGKIAKIGEENYPSLQPGNGSSLLGPVADVNIASPLRALAKPIGLLEISTADKGRALCTGWLIDPSHVITAEYCVANAQPSALTFRLGFISNQSTGDVYKISKVERKVIPLPDQSPIGIGNDRKIAGFAVLTLAVDAGGKYGWLKPADRLPKVGERLAIIHQAMGGPQMIANGECVVVETTKEAEHIIGIGVAFQYQCENAPGGGGAPVIAISDNTVLGIVLASSYNNTSGGYGLLIGPIVKNTDLVHKTADTTWPVEGR